MRDFLNHVENSDLYLPDVKIPSLKIKEMVKKRWDLIQEIKVGFYSSRKLNKKTTGNFKQRENRSITGFSKAKALSE